MTRLTVHRRSACLAALALVAGAAWAQNSPVGLWRTIDDDTGQPKAEIRIVERGGLLTGVVERALNPSLTPTCDRCTDDRKDQPKIGMEIIRGARQTPGENAWEGGNILDPENGKVYRLSLVPLDEGARLQVRGYIGPFYRTQTWIRVP